MRLWISSVAIAAACFLTPAATGNAPAWGQDFSITNQAVSPNPVRRDLMRQLQAWWDAHAYYPRHAASSDEQGTVKVHLVIIPDGRIWTIELVESSGSRSLDVAGNAVFRGASVQPFPETEPNIPIDLALHYVLARRHDQPVTAGYASMASQRPFTVTNDPVRSPILDAMLQRACTGTMVLGGMPNHPAYGMHLWAQAIFFRKPDGTPWVKFNERGYLSLSPVTQIGKMVTWTGRQEWVGRDLTLWRQYTVWSDGDNRLRGVIGMRWVRAGVPYNHNSAGDTVDLTCATEALPNISWSDWLAQGTISASPFDLSSGDPP